MMAELPKFVDLPLAKQLLCVIFFYGIEIYRYKIILSKMAFHAIVEKWEKCHFIILLIHSFYQICSILL